MNAYISARGDSDPEKKTVSRQSAQDVLGTLPEGIARFRILNAAQSAAFWGVSLPQWRRLYRMKRVPSPVMLSERRMGWRVGDLIDALATRTAA
jgi:predicted DNA-binding transcriptional regulator AlpA